MTTSETEEMLKKCHELGCCGNFLLTDIPCDVWFNESCKRCPVLTDIRLYIEELNKGEK
tara:strand:+ start:795 stop:971 length:177 start_codon:yes stop_codon:yes gene_type:complete